MARLAAFRSYIRESLWVAPFFGVLFAAGLAILNLRLDEEITIGSALIIGFDGGADSARSVLGTIASSMLTFLALVFTLTVVALQLATDFSPRLMRNFLVDRVSKLALATFVATFVYAVLILREVTSTRVPELSVSVAIGLVIFSVLIFVYYLSSITQSLRVASIVERAGAGARSEIRRLYTSEEEPGSEDEERSNGWAEIDGVEPDLIMGWPHSSGTVSAIALDGLRSTARDREIVIELGFEVGDFLPEGARAVAIYGSDEPLSDGLLRNAVATASERDLHQDPAFGLRQLVDVAARALSPGVNDPTTAVQAIDQIHDLLLRLGRARLHSGVLRDEDDKLSVLIPVHSWDDYVRLAVEEIRIYGEGSIGVARRLRTMLRDLLRTLPENRRGPLQRQLDLLDSSIERDFADSSDRKRAKDTGDGAAGTEGGSAE